MNLPGDVGADDDSRAVIVACIRSNGIESKSGAHALIR